MVADQDIQIHDFTVRVRRMRISGCGPILVFLHDSLGCIETWRDFPQHLGERVGLDVLIYDRRGYGQSAPFAPEKRTIRYLHDEADVFFALMDKLKIERSVLFGHSDGGSIALLAAALRPKAIAAVITEGAHVMVEQASLTGLLEARDAYASTNLRERLRRYHGEKTDALVSAWIDTWLSPEFRNWNIEFQLSLIKCPVMAIQGELDEYGTADQVNAIVRGAKAKGLMLPGLRHSPHKEDPEAVLEASAEFLKQAIETPTRE